jgi:hypothetical protein
MPFSWLTWSVMKWFSLSIKWAAHVNASCFSSTVSSKLLRYSSSSFVGPERSKAVILVYTHPGCTRPSAVNRPSACQRRPFCQLLQAGGSPTDAGIFSVYFLESQGRKRTVSSGHGGWSALACADALLPGVQRNRQPYSLSKEYSS